MKADWTAPTRTALVIIDCQVDFGSPDGEMARRGKDMTAPQAAVWEAGQLVDAARVAKVRVIFVRLLTQSGGEEGLCVEGTRGADFIGPQPQAGEAVVSKTRYSAFSHTGLAEQLRSAGVETVVLAGLTTECCVASTAWAAFDEGFHIVIDPNACAAYELALHESALRALWLSGAKLAPLSDIVAAWNKFN